MQPIQFFHHQQTVWYNLSDYIQLLLDRQIIHSLRPASLFKRKPPAKSIQAILFDKINRLSPVYQRQQDGRVYIDWVIFEHLYRLIRPYLIHPDDWINPESLFRQLQAAIDRLERSPPLSSSDTIADYFTEIKYTYPDDVAHKGVNE